MRTTRLAALAVAAVLAIGACDGNDDDDDAATTPAAASPAAADESPTVTPVPEEDGAEDEAAD